MVQGTDCVYCSNVTGYQVSQVNNDCSEICGDGIVIYYQCDDGNTVSGDGCSSNCLIESGWKCSSINRSTSACILTTSINMSLASIYKYSGSNKVNVGIQLSLPVLLANHFSLTIGNISNSLYNWTAYQNANNLSFVSLDISYSVDLQNQGIDISYLSSRRLLSIEEDTNKSNSLRMLTALSFSTSFSLNSFPPANYYPN